MIKTRMFFTSIYYSLCSGYTWKRVWGIIQTSFFLLGAYWTLVEFASFLLEGIPTLKQNQTYKDILRTFVWNNLGYEFGLLTFIAAVINRRKISEIVKINNSDLVIEFKFCDIFAQEGAKVIAVMDTFDTDCRDNLVDRKTLHGIFISKFYEGVEQNLDNEISASLTRTGAALITTDNTLRGKKDKYSIGTTAIVQPSNEYFYLTAVASQTNTGNVVIQPEYIFDALANLWQFIPRYGRPIDTVNIPLVGKGLNRLPPEYTHQKIAREIANSFITSSKQTTFCKKLRICIYPKDYQYINMKKLIDYINHLKEYNFL